MIILRLIFIQTSEIFVPQPDTNEYKHLNWYKKFQTKERFQVTHIYIRYKLGTFENNYSACRV